MRKKKNIMVAITAFVLFGIIVWQIYAITTKADPLTETAARTLAQEMYDGEIVGFDQRKDRFFIKMKVKSQLYEIEMNQKTGEIIGLTKAGINNEKLREITEKKVREIINEKYNGKITSIEKKEAKDMNVFQVKITEGTKQMTVELDSETGAVMDSYTEEKPTPDLVQQLTEKEAISVAQKNVDGEVDDVDIEEVDGHIYYLVEIEQAEGAEATVQINAITGDVMTIVWED